MIYLGFIMFFRHEKYRLVTLLESFVIFHFSTIIAEYCTFTGRHILCLSHHFLRLGDW